MVKFHLYNRIQEKYNFKNAILFVKTVKKCKEMLTKNQ